MSRGWWIVPLILAAYLAMCVAVGKLLKRAGASYPQPRPAQGFVLSCGDTVEWCDTPEDAGELAAELWARPGCPGFVIHPLVADEVDAT